MNERSGKMEGIQRIREAIEAGESMTTEDIVLSFLEECILRDIEPRGAWEALQKFIPRLKAILAEQEKQKAAKECDSLTAIDGMPYEEHTNKKL